MNLTLLLDLDNTLISNDMSTFLPVYFKGLSARFTQWPGDQFVQKLLAATRVMVTKNQPRLTLEQAFDRVFYPSLGIRKADAAAELEEFYSEEFGTFHYLTEKRPEAVDLVNQAHAAGAKIVVATNPIFPRSAILHRIHWAGFPDESPFSLVTSFESLHFAKPNPAYYAEILAQMGFPDQPAVMVGDSLDDDILPAAALGIPGFLITDKPVTLPEGLNAPVHQGKIGEVWHWIETNIEHWAAYKPAHSRKAILATLKSTPAAIESCCRKVNPVCWNRRPSQDEWAINEILCHLRDVDREVNFVRVRQVLDEQEPFLPGLDTDQWAEERKYIDQPGAEALEAYFESRSAMTEMLEQLPAEGWDRLARHAIFGPTNLLELTSFMATHDIVHVRQAAQTMCVIRRD
jgi:FMN phosphatase YigB (HAD superfamily)